MNSAPSCFAVLFYHRPRRGQPMMEPQESQAHPFPFIDHLRQVVVMTESLLKMNFLLMPKVMLQIFFSFWCICQQFFQEGTKVGVGL